MLRIRVARISDCPNSAAAVRRARIALTLLGVPGRVDQVVVHDAATAAAVGFAGSPTLLVDGVDLFPSSAIPEGLACRNYPAEEGMPVAPTAEQIVAALRARGVA
jgi:glutathione S-transferase